ncbi:hypothetical protein L6164_002818 [Bauhinia variegata]|uniref:Uncharacterized protein n=1 Tax=Bauhinia variegata TaxID=167791 RepID=A0ACB9Q1G9_BAUVA|nr:hypothetical protein L6164_002818 [Bauhinia variegata]
MGDYLGLDVTSDLSRCIIEIILIKAKAANERDTVNQLVFDEDCAQQYSSNLFLLKKSSANCITWVLSLHQEPIPRFQIRELFVNSCP